jgi:hypothetical protein
MISRVDLVMFHYVETQPAMILRAGLDAEQFLEERTGMRVVW